MEITDALIEKIIEGNLAIDKKVQEGSKKKKDKQISNITKYISDDFIEENFISVLEKDFEKDKNNYYSLFPPAWGGVC